jgi:hypothetical protein
VSHDIRRMSKAELDELNRNAKEWRERIEALQRVTIPEPSQDGPKPSSLVPGGQMELL